MKFTCKKSDFSNGINIAMKAILSKTTMPTLECFLIEAGGGKVKITSNDMQLAIETSFEADVSEDGIVLMNAKNLAGYISHMSEDTVEFESDASNTILLFSGMRRHEEKGMADDDFPRLPAIDFSDKVTISQFALKEMIRQTIFSISSKENNKILTGELFEVQGDELRIASLDLIRVSIRKIRLSQSYEKIKVVIPGKTLNEISKVMSNDADELVDISFSKNHVRFEFGNTVMISRLIEGNFFNIDQMLKNNYETKVIVNKNRFFNCIDSSTLLMTETDKNPVIFTMQEDEMKVEIRSSHSSMNEDIPIQMEGKDLKIGLNPKYIVDVLRVIDDEDVHMYFFNSNSPCFIKNEDETYIYLILPINI